MPIVDPEAGTYPAYAFIQYAEAYHASASAPLASSYKTVAAVQADFDAAVKALGWSLYQPYEWDDDDFVASATLKIGAAEAEDLLLVFASETDDYFKFTFVTGEEPDTQSWEGYYYLKDGNVDIYKAGEADPTFEFAAREGAKDYTGDWTLGEGEGLITLHVDEFLPTSSEAILYVIDENNNAIRVIADIEESYGKYTLSLIT